MPWVTRGISNGKLTTGWPQRPDAYFDEFSASINVNQNALAADSVRVQQAVAACPTGAITAGPGGITLDRGKCILCGRCASIAPETFAFAPGSGIAALSRGQLVVGGREETPEALESVRHSLALRVRQLRQSVHIRHVDAGSDGSDEWEVQALLNPVYDIHRLGIFFTASPRHADVLLVTGIGTEGMREPLRLTHDGMPRPVVTIAAGTDAISGGLIGGGYTGGHGVGDLLDVDVDVWIPGSPASPFSLLQGILLAIGRLPESSPGRVAQ